jgi:hypothetical protein
MKDVTGEYVALGSMDYGLRIGIGWSDGVEVR